MAPPRKKPTPSKGVNQAAAKAIPPQRPPSKGVNQAAATAVPARRPGGMAARLRPKPAKKAPVRPPAGRKPPARTTTPPAAPPATGGAPAAPGGPVATGAVPGATSSAPAADIETTARNLYGYMSWALDDPELGKVLRQAAAEGWDESRLKGAVFATNWFRTHGTHKVATQLKEQADAYLVPMDDGSRRNFAMKIITGEVQPTEMGDYIKGQAASMFAHNPELVDAIKRGISVTDYAAPFRGKTAQVLEMPPESIDLNQSKYRRMLDGVTDEKGTRRPYTISEWENTLRTDDQYGWRFTKNAKDKTYDQIAYLNQKFGLSG